jgi:hypothetical protein
MARLTRVETATDGAELTLFVWHEFCERAEPPPVKGPSVSEAIELLREAMQIPSRNSWLRDAVLRIAFPASNNGSSFRAIAEEIATGTHSFTTEAEVNRAFQE